MRIRYDKSEPLNNDYFEGSFVDEEGNYNEGYCWKEKGIWYLKDINNIIYEMDSDELFISFGIQLKKNLWLPI